MIQRVYIDTSVVGGIYDIEFDIFTKMFFDKAFRGEITLIVSDLLEEELINAPTDIKTFFKTLPTEQLEFVKLTKDSIALAELYIAEKVVGETSRADCRHIALATINKADVLVSWNFKHIVNLKRIRGYNSINLREGLHTLEIRSPKELMEYEN
jgi:predicted nucleic acid-binding protein